MPPPSVLGSSATADACGLRRPGPMAARVPRTAGIRDLGDVASDRIAERL